VASSWPSEVPFASLLIYSPKGSSEVSGKSRQVCYAIKRGDTQLLAQAVQVIAQVFQESGFGAFLGPDVGLVPAPGSAPHVPGGLWPAELIARALVKAKLGHEVVPCLRRTVAVPKSAFAPPGERPTIHQHFETLEVERTLLVPSRLTIVDDVVTKGRTLLACARRLQDSNPNADVRCFAMVRTMGLQPGVEAIVSACQGRIRCAGADAEREP